MCASLLIRDGTPHWWDSQDIWTVPGDDPDGPPGPPVAGERCFVWAKVGNTGQPGEPPLMGVEVRFYWSNPAGGVLRRNANLIGSAFVDLAVGDEEEVLCLSPWVPIIVNGGHECLVAEALHPADPLPNPLPDPFDPQSYRQVAQRNVDVIQLGAARVSIPFEVATPTGEQRATTLEIRHGGTAGAKLLEQAGLAGFKPAPSPMAGVGLALTAGAFPGQPRLDLTLPPKSTQAVYLLVEPRALGPKLYQLVQVTESSGGRLLGGISFLIVKEG